MFSRGIRPSSGRISLPHAYPARHLFRPLRLANPAAPHSRSLHLAPPYLLDDYIPRYHLLASTAASKKRSLAYSHLQNCNLCPRKCGVNRFEKAGYCLIEGNTVKVNVIAPHFGEEPCVQGYNGSGSVFFSGCNLRCVFCQNYVSVPHAHCRCFDIRPSYHGYKFDRVLFRTYHINGTASILHQRNLRNGT